MWGGVNRLVILSCRMRLTRSSCSLFSTVWMHLLRIVSVFLTCFSMAAAMVLGGVGCSLARIVIVWSAEFSRRCFMMTRLRLKEMALWAYWVT